MERDDSQCRAIYEIHIWAVYKNFDSCWNRTKITDTLYIYDMSPLLAFVIAA